MGGRAGRTSVRTISIAVMLALALAGVTAIASAAPGDLDAGFGKGGKVITPFADDGFASDVVALADGWLIAAGGEGFTLARYNADGSLDSSFGAGGRVATRVGSGLQSAQAVAVQPDGRIVAAGGQENDTVITIVRHLSDGSLDATFGAGGIVRTRLPGGTGARGLAVEADGDLVVAAAAQDERGRPPFALVRYRPDGELDSSFGAGGTALASFDQRAEAHALVLQPDGGLVAAGEAGDAIALARYGADGRLDPAFGSGGKVLTRFGSSSGSDSTCYSARAFGLAAAPGGGLMAVGSAAFGAFAQAAAVRYRPDGSLDESFGSGGRVTIRFTARSGGRAAGRAKTGPCGDPIGGYETSAGRDLIVDGGGRAVLAAILFRHSSGCCGTDTGRDEQRFALARLNPDGSLDSGFGSGGKVLTEFEECQALPFAIASRGEDSFVVAGLSRTRVGRARYALAAYGGPAPAPSTPDCTAPPTESTGTGTTTGTGAATTGGASPGAVLPRPASRLSARSRSTSGRRSVTVETTGTLTVPGTRRGPNVCRGRVRVSVRAGRRVLSTGLARVDGRCRFAVLSRVRRPRRARVLNVAARFEGSPASAPARARTDFIRIR